MAFYLDSARRADAEAAHQLGWVRGATTNPTLLAQSDMSPAEALRTLAGLFPGEIFYQLTAPDLEGMLEESQRARQVVGTQLVLKIPATPTGFQAVARLSEETPCAVTAIFSPAQTAVAAAAGARYIIPYVNRSTRLLGDGLALVRAMAEVLQGSGVELLAASFKSTTEAAAALAAGAQHLTLKPEVLHAMAEQELSRQAVAEFARTGTGLAAVIT